MLSLLMLAALTVQEQGDSPIFTGDLLRIEDNKLILGVRKDGLKAGEETFTINDHTQIVIEGRGARYEDLRIGRPVRIAHRDRVALRIEVPRSKGEGREADRRLREEERPAADRERAEDEAAARRRLEERGRAERREGDRPVERREGERPPDGRREGERPAVDRREGERPVERREGERPVERRGADRERAEDEAAERRRAEERAREEAPFPVDPAIVPPAEKQPDQGGRVLSVFEDDAATLLTLRRGVTEVPIFIPKGTAMTYVGIEKENQSPKAGYIVYIWLKEGSRDTAARATFGLRK